jgi:hypothetical protein
MSAINEPLARAKTRAQASIDKGYLYSSDDPLLAVAIELRQVNANLEKLVKFESKREYDRYRRGVRDVTPRVPQADKSKLRRLWEKVSR